MAQCEGGGGIRRDDKVLMDLGTAATQVTQALNDLLQHIKKGAGPTKVRSGPDSNEVEAKAL